MVSLASNHGAHLRVARPGREGEHREREHGVREDPPEPTYFATLSVAMLIWLSPPSWRNIG